MAKLKRFEIEKKNKFRVLVNKDKLDRALTRIKELKAVIDRLGTIHSEEWGSSETEYEEELNHLFEQKTMKEFKYE